MYVALIFYNTNTGFALYVVLYHVDYIYLTFKDFTNILQFEPHHPPPPSHNRVCSSGRGGVRASAGAMYEYYEAQHR